MSPWSMYVSDYLYPATGSCCRKYGNSVSRKSEDAFLARRHGAPKATLASCNNALDVARIADQAALDPQPAARDRGKGELRADATGAKFHDGTTNATIAAGGI